MAVTVIDGSKGPARCVRTLMYDDESELTGDTIVTDNAGTIECEYGTLAYKAGGVNPRWYDHDGVWKRKKVVNNG